MSNNQSGDNADSISTELQDDSALQNDPVLHGHSALNDPNLSGSTAASWTGTGGPDPGGVAGPADLDDQGGPSDRSGSNAGGSSS